jgi:uncharacterized protein (TIGR03437 family)
LLKTFSLGLILLNSTVAMAAAQEFRLGVNYSELIPSGSLSSIYGVMTATDSQGYLYVLMSGPASAQSTTIVSYLGKLNQNQIVYQNSLNYNPAAMTVDPAGSVYLATSDSNNVYSVVKLAASGSTVDYTMALGANVVVTGLVVDATGRAYITGFTPGNGIQTTPGALQTAPASSSGTAYNAFVMRLKTTGAVDFATYLGGSSQAQAASIAVDAAGSAFVSGTAFSLDFPTTQGAYLTAAGIHNFNYAPFLVRLSPDGSSLIYSTFSNASGDYTCCMAVDSADEAVVVLGNIPSTQTVVNRFNAEGTALEFSKQMPALAPAAMALDAAGNIYLGGSANPNYPVLNSLAPCQTTASGAVTVLDANGNVLQTTYIPGASGYAPIALGTDSNVYVVGVPSSTYSATRQLGGASGGLVFITSLTENLNAPIVQLACVANAASYDSAGISGGEIVSLFGQGLGPAAGTQPQSESNGVPEKLAGVQVTFNGIASPLLYVQNGQINAIAPWALEAGGNVNVCVVYDGAATNCITRPGLNVHPGVFMLNAVYAAALNQDGSFNSASNPAQVGSVVSVFATGLGPISPAQPDGSIIGLPLPVDSLPAYVYWLEDTGFIGTIAESTPVSYAGPAPYEVAGVSQINFVVADTTEPNIGHAPFVLQAGGSPPIGVLFGGGSNAFLVYVAGQ